MGDTEMILKVLGAVASMITIVIFINSFIRRKKKIVNEISKSNTANLNNSDYNATVQGNNNQTSVNNTTNFYNENNNTDIKKEREELFNEVKNLMIEFLSTIIDKNKNEEDINEQYKVFTKIKTNMGYIASLKNTNAHDIIWELAKSEISAKHKLTTRKLALMTDIIKNMNPLIYEENSFNTYEKLYLGNAQDDKDTVSFPSTYYRLKDIDTIKNRLIELESCKWDDYIKDSI